jgi:hypothetical protein
LKSLECLWRAIDDEYRSRTPAHDRLLARLKLAQIKIDWPAGASVDASGSIWSIIGNRDANIPTAAAAPVAT